MKKIPSEMDNPIDNFLNQISEALCPYFSKMGHTPNMITPYSRIFGLLAVFCLYSHYPAGFVICYIMSYFFDCMDGHYARKYNMTTRAGDLYDHIKDIVIFVMIVFAVYRIYGKAITFPYLLVFGIVCFLCITHLGCQQKQKLQEVIDCQTEETELLDNCKVLCANKDMIYYTRWVGMGTMNVVILILFVLLDRQCAGKCYTN